MNERIYNIAQIAYSFVETVEHTYKSVIDVIRDGTPGQLVECGVAAGGQIAAMQYALEVMNSSREILAIDSFEGIPLGNTLDGEQPGIGAFTHDPTLPLSQRLISSGISVHSVDNVIENLNNLNLSHENIIFIKGWFQETLPLLTLTNIALLRLDGDLYESTEVCLKYLYPKVSKNGIVIIDDYALRGCNQAVKDYFKDKLPKMYEVKGGGGPVWFKK